MKVTLDVLHIHDDDDLTQDTTTTLPNLKFKSTSSQNI